MQPESMTLYGLACWKFTVEIFVQPWKVRPNSVVIFAAQEHNEAWLVTVMRSIFPTNVNCALSNNIHLLIGSISLYITPSMLLWAIVQRLHDGSIPWLRTCLINSVTVITTLYIVVLRIPRNERSEEIHIFL